jgi:hypothetical protein
MIGEYDHDVETLAGTTKTTLGQGLFGCTATRYCTCLVLRNGKAPIIVETLRAMKLNHQYRPPGQQVSLEKCSHISAIRAKDGHCLITWCICLYKLRPGYLLEK